MTELRDRLQSALGTTYAVERELGGGGMSRVFVAEEAELGRKVVIKVLPPELAEGVSAERFRREIQLAARLQHPHIVPLLAAGARGDLLYYAMPLIEGESLRARIAGRGAIPPGEAVRLLRDVVDALAYAHGRGIVHRDIKPDNVLVSGNHAVVTDFGVAKALSQARTQGGGPWGQSPTLDSDPKASKASSTLTSLGVALGSPAYMAPEQAAGDPNVDHRADIYSLGCMAYELLAGQPPFVKGSSHQVLAAHVMETPAPLRTVRPEVPEALAAVVMRCLEKDADRRWQTAEALLGQLEALATPSSGHVPTSARMPAAGRGADARGGRRMALGAAAGAALVAAVGVGGWLVSRRAAPGLAIGNTVQVTNTPGLEIDPAISPDGKMLAYVTGGPGRTRIVVRQIGGGRAVTLTGDLPGEHRWPQWSPDGATIAFLSGTGIHVVPALGGAPRRLAELSGDESSQATLAWSPDGTRLAYTHGSTLWVMPVAGGAPAKVVDGRSPHSPAWSPDGTRLAFVSDNQSYVRLDVLANIAPSAILVVPAAGGPAVAATDSVQLNVSPAWTPDGRELLFISSRGGGRDVYRQPVAASGAPAGEPQRLTTGLSAYSLSLSADGSRLAYASLAGTANLHAIDIPASGVASARAAVAVTAENQSIEGIGVSADGQWLAFDSNRGGNQDVYKLPARCTAAGEGDGCREPVQLTRDAAADFLPSWSPDGREIAFYSWRSGNRDLYLMSADGTGERRLTSDSTHEYYPDWSPDGKHLAFSSNRGGRFQVWVLDRAADGSWGAPRQLTRDPAGTGIYPRWSPDGRWITGGRASGVPLVSAADGGMRFLVDSAWARRVASPIFADWSPDGRLVYFKATDAAGSDSFWAVPVEGGVPRQLVTFDDPTRPTRRPEFATDGRRFYFTIASQESDLWVMELRRER